jgi:hypothetical protein
MNALSCSLYWVIPSHRGAHRAPARETGKCGINDRAKNFAHPVGAEVEAKHAISVLNAMEVGDDRRQHELVAEIMGIGVGNDGIGTWKARPTIAS